MVADLEEKMDNSNFVMPSAMEFYATQSPEKKKILDFTEDSQVASENSFKDMKSFHLENISEA